MIKNRISGRRNQQRHHRLFDGRQWHENDRCHFCIPQFGDICEALRSEHGTLHREFGLCIRNSENRIKIWENHAGINIFINHKLNWTFEKNIIILHRVSLRQTPVK